jgi:predicted Holliday junction resolvase-like endonuclease
MPKIAMNADISSLLDFYRKEHRIFGRCPHCGEAFRLSETKLTYGKEPPRDLLSQMKKERDRLDSQIQDLEDELEAARSEHESAMEVAEQKWEERFDVEVDRRIARETKRIRKEAIERSRVTTLGKTIERIAPLFSGFGYHPGDVRPLFEPVDFVIFDGLWSREVSELVFVEFKTGGSRMSPVQESIREAVGRKRVRFEERRITTDTLKRITKGNARQEAIVEEGKQRPR